MVSLDFAILSRTNAPPGGSWITALVSLSPRRFALLQRDGAISTGGTFSYTVTYHKGTARALSSVLLSLPVPPDTSFSPRTDVRGATDVETIDVTPALSYALTTTANAVGPGLVTLFKVSVTNLIRTCRSSITLVLLFSEWLSLSLA